MKRSGLMTFLVVISVMNGIIVGALVGATAGVWIGVSLGVGSAAALWALVVVIGLTTSHFGTWGTLYRRYPAAEGTDFGRSRMVSMGLGTWWFKLNGCVEGRADESHVHLRIGLPGADTRPLSIPWEAVGAVEQAAFGMARLDVEGSAIWLPRVLVKDELELRRAMQAREAEGMGEEGAGGVEGAGGAEDAP